MSTLEVHRRFNGEFGTTFATIVDVLRGHTEFQTAKQFISKGHTALLAR